MNGYPVDKQSTIPLEQRWNAYNEKVPPPTHNGGLYSGPAYCGSWGNTPVIPTTAYMIHHNLKSANPPPGAIYQYPGTNRKGNNYIAMPGVNWYIDTPKNNLGPFTIKVPKQ